MQVKVFKELNYLPNVFLTPDLNKFSLSNRFVNCAHYQSRSGATFSGCLKVNEFEDKIYMDSVKETLGIYYTPHDPIIHISYRQKALSNLDDIKEVLASLDFSKVSLKQDKLLVKYDNYYIEIYDIYYKGRKYEFPLISKQGHLSVYEVPSPRNVYQIEYQGDQKIEKLDEEMFEKFKGLNIYNHIIEFEAEVFVYKNLYVMPGDGALIFIPQNMAINVQSPDHEPRFFTVVGNTWLLFSHPRPHRNSQDWFF